MYVSFGKKNDENTANAASILVKDPKLIVQRPQEASEDLNFAETHHHGDFPMNYYMDEIFSKNNKETNEQSLSVKFTKMNYIIMFIIYV